MTAPFRHRLLVASAILLAATPAVRATNPGWEPCSSSGGPCEDKSSAAASSASDPPKNESLDWSVKVGLARYAKPTDFTNFGQAAFEKNGNLPTFAEMFGRYFSPSPFQQIQIHLELSQSQISAATFHPSCLFLQSEANFEKLTKPPADGFGEYIHQILTDDCFTLIDLLPEADSGWRLRVWKRDAAALTSVDGLYVTTGFVAETPLNDVIFKRSSTGGDNTLLYIQEQTTGLSGTRIITNKIVQTLDENGKPDVVTSEIFKGDSTASGDLLSKQTLTYSERGSKVWDYTIKRVVETASVNTVGGIGALDLTAQSSEDYDDYSVEAGGGELGMKRLVSRTEAFDVSGQSPQTTTYTYYDTPTNLTVHGRLKKTVHPDGSWNTNDYTISSSSPVAITTQYSGWKDILVAAKTTAKTTVTTVNANDTVVEVFVGTQLISKTKTTLGTFGSLPITKTHRWDGDHWHVTATAYYADDAAAPSTGRIKWIENSDGTAATYSYATVGGKLVSTVLSGAGTHSGITAGTEVVTTHNLGNIPIEQVTTDIATEIVTEHWIYEATSGFDALGRPVKRVYNAEPSDYDITQYACCGLEESRSRDGSSIKYYRDGLKRVYKVETKASAGSPVVATFTVEDDLITTQTRKVGSEESFFLGSTIRSLDGLTQTSIAPSQKSDNDEDRPTTTSVTVHSATGDTVTTTYQDGSNSINAYYLSRQPRSISGTAVADKAYDYGAHDENGGGLTSTATASGVAVTTYTDLLGRTAKVVSPATGTTTYGYYAHDDAAGSCGNLHTVTDADSVVITYGYDSEGERVTTSRTVPLASGTATQVSTTEHDVMDNVILHSTNLNTLHRTTQKISSTDVSAITTSKSYASIDGLKSGSRSFDRDTLVVSTRPNVTTGVATTTTTHPDGTSTVQTSTHGLVTSVEHKNSAGGVIYSTTYTHDDAHQWIETVTDSRTGTTTYSNFTESGQALTVTSPGSDETTIENDSLGRTIATTLPDESVTHTSYYPTGQVKAKWGSQTYPVFHIYDEQNRRTDLRTYQDLATEPLLANEDYARTRWIYSATTGLLESKKDHATKGPSYTYSAAGRLATRTWERGSVTTYIHTHGFLTGTTYTGDDTPNVTFTHEALGRRSTVAQTNRSLTSYTYAADLSVDTETISYDVNGDGDFADSVDLTRVLDRAPVDAFGRDKGWELKLSTTVQHLADYTYDTAGRLSTVADAASGTFTYGYKYSQTLATDPRVGATAGAKEDFMPYTVTSPVHTVTNTFEARRDVLLTKAHTKISNSAEISTIGYTVNSLGQRTNATRSGAATNDTIWDYDNLGQVILANDDTTAAHDRAYQYDTIGNRLFAETSNTVISDPVVAGTTAYTVNTRNQYTALVKNAVTVSPEFDSDGNAIEYPLPVAPTVNSGLTWDAENRMTTSTVGSTVTTYLYDAFSRRIAKIPTSGSGIATLYIYDGWNCIAEYTGTTLSKTYLWGMDISGSMQGAGGVGGLLAVKQGGNYFYPTYDGNGNVTEYLESDEDIAAHFEYDPFGNLTVDTNSNAESFPYRFSTKPQDGETGLYYYTYRYYDPLTGRWPSRDPIEEEGGLNLYGFVGNDGVNALDLLGGIIYRPDEKRKRRRASPPIPDGLKDGEVYIYCECISEGYCGCSDFEGNILNKCEKATSGIVIAHFRNSFDFVKDTLAHALGDGRNRSYGLAEQKCVNNPDEKCNKYLEEKGSCACAIYFNGEFYGNNMGLLVPGGMGPPYPDLEWDKWNDFDLR